MLPLWWVACLPGSPTFWMHQRLQECSSCPSPWAQSSSHVFLAVGSLRWMLYIGDKMSWMWSYLALCCLLSGVGKHLAHTASWAPSLFWFFCHTSWTSWSHKLHLYRRMTCSCIHLHIQVVPPALRKISTRHFIDSICVWPGCSCLWLQPSTNDRSQSMTSTMLWTTSLHVVHDEAFQCPASLFAKRVIMYYLVKRCSSVVACPEDRILQGHSSHRWLQLQQVLMVQAPLLSLGLSVDLCPFLLQLSWHLNRRLVPHLKISG